MHAIIPRLAAVYCFACTYYCYFTILANMYTRIALATNTFVASAQKKPSLIYVIYNGRPGNIDHSLLIFYSSYTYSSIHCVY